MLKWPKWWHGKSNCLRQESNEKGSAWSNQTVVRPYDLIYIGLVLENPRHNRSRHWVLKLRFNNAFVRLSATKSNSCFLTLSYACVLILSLYKIWFAELPCLATALLRLLLFLHPSSAVLGLCYSDQNAAGETSQVPPGSSFQHKTIWFDRQISSLILLKS